MAEKKEKQINSGSYIRSINVSSSTDAAFEERPELEIQEVDQSSDSSNDEDQDSNSSNDEDQDSNS